MVDVRRVDNTNPNSPEPVATLNYSALKRVSRQRVVPVLNEDDLEESFIKGRGA